MFLQLSPVPKATHPQQSRTCGVNTKSSLKARAFPSLTPETINFIPKEEFRAGAEARNEPDQRRWRSDRGPAPRSDQGYSWN